MSDDRREGKGIYPEDWLRKITVEREILITNTTNCAALFGLSVAGFRQWLQTVDNLEPVLREGREVFYDIAQVGCRRRCGIHRHTGEVAPWLKRR